MHLVIVRHARSTANTEGVLAGRMPGVHLDEAGRSQAEHLLTRITGVDVTSIVGSPLTRCRETAEALCIERKLPYLIDDRLTEVDYGSWSGRSLKELSETALWNQIQNQPTRVTFPNGEPMRDVFARAAHFLEEMKDRQEHEVVLAFTHGDVAKALISVALAANPDEFQRIVVDPASITVVRISPERPFVLRVNDSATTVVEMLTKTSNQGAVGGGR